jgi:hypothetical protein
MQLFRMRLLLIKAHPFLETLVPTAEHQPKPVSQHPKEIFPQAMSH